jgi:hypothetical protein
MKNNAELFTGDQQGIPGCEYKSGNWKSVAFIADLYGVSEQSIRDWIDAKIIETPINRLLNVIEVLRAVYRHQRNLIERMGSQPLTDERLKVITIKREISELELKKLRGELIEVDKIKRVAFARAKSEAEMLDVLPSRLKSILAAESDEFKVGEILRDALDQVRTHVISQLKTEA